MKEIMLPFLLRVLGIVVTLLTFASGALSQIQSTITCPAGHSYWDTLSVMIMDNGLNANYHLEGTHKDGSPAYKYTTWKQTQNKVDYVKDPKGHPWDVFLYDSNFVYHWITEAPGSGFNDPYQFKKNNNESGSATADFSFPWVARCAAPGGDNSTLWVEPPSVNPIINTGYELHTDPSDSCNKTGYSDSKYALFELKPTATDTLYDYRTNPPTAVPVTTLPLQYTYQCTAKDVTTCRDREVFTFAVDTDKNPVDGLKHSYGWIRWRLFTSTDGVNWTEQNWSLTDRLKLTLGTDGQMDFPCSTN